MAMNEERMIELFRNLPEQDQNSTIDFMEYLSNRKTKQLQDFYANLPEVDEPFSEEELRQMQDQDTEFISLDELAKELELNDESSFK